MQGLADPLWHQPLPAAEAAVLASRHSTVLTAPRRRDVLMSCAWASRLWARVFLASGIAITFCEGFYHDRGRAVGHTWLELASGALFDPTAGQFSHPGDPESYTITDSFDLWEMSDLERLDAPPVLP